VKKQFIQIADGKRCIYLSEPNGRPQMFCIHGGMGLSADSLIASLTPLQTEFDLVFVDQRGCGESAPASDGRYDLSDFAKDISEIVAAVGTSRPRGILGHSLGGMVAIETLASYPNLFDFAILSNSAMNDEWRTAAGEAVRRLDSPSVDEANSRFDKEPSRDDLIRDVAIEYGPIYFPEFSVAQAKERMARFTYRAATIQYTGEHVYPGMDLTEAVSAVAVPALVIAGEADIVVPKSCQEKLSMALKHGLLSAVPGAGHFPFVTESAKTTQAILNWWNDVRRSVL
jgi:proline iminopeptidase